MDALQLKITPFMLDSYTHEYEDIVRTREAHLIEVDSLRNANRHLTAQVYVLYIVRLFAHFLRLTLLFLSQ